MAQPWFVAGACMTVLLPLWSCSDTEPPVTAPTAAATSTPAAGDASRHQRNRYFQRKDADVTKIEPGPHAGTGQTTAYRYFDDVKDARVIFRKRAMPKGASIGMHVLSHDEVYYIVSGTGELAVDDVKTHVGPDQAIFMHEGADVGLRQTGEADLVVIIAYPPAEVH